jgi:hypothetical protein
LYQEKTKKQPFASEIFFLDQTHNPLIPSFYHTRVIKPTSSQTPADQATNTAHATSSNSA